MQVLDMVYLALIGLLVLRGFLKGFTGEFFSIASLALGISAAALLFRQGAHFLRSNYLPAAMLPEIFAFLVIFIAVFFMTKIVERIVKDIIDRLGLETLDKTLGIVLGLAESFALIILSLFFLSIQQIFDHTPLVEHSIFAQLLLPFVEVFHV